jgi:hypothetical protein
MKRLGELGWMIGILGATLLASPGCTYKGAIYSSYQEAGLGIRTTAESTAPIKVHFGYDHSVGAFVPRRGGDAANEEATSIISKEQVGAGVNPLQTATEDLLMVDSAFITGTAAIVASAPSGATVKVRPAATACPACPGVATEAGSNTFVATGSPGERIATALTQRPGTLTDAQIRLAEVGTLIDGTPPERQDAIYAAAAAKLPTNFQQAYEKRRTEQQLSSRVAFRATMLEYLAGESDDSPKRAEFHGALSAALQEK